MAQQPQTQPNLENFKARIATLSGLYNEMADEKMALAYAHKVLGTNEGYPLVPCFLCPFLLSSPFFFFLGSLRLYPIGAAIPV